MSTTGILNVGDELLAGEVTNSNATWLADQQSERGVTVGEIRVVPDARPSIKAAVTEFSTEFDRTLVTGGLGSTPDDVTLEAVARALDRSLKENDAARADIERTVRKIETEYPGFEHDIDAAARFPTGARVIPNDEGIVPGCVIDNVYVLPGVPTEMKAVYRRIEHEFSGDMRTRAVVSDTPESHLNPLLMELQDRFDVDVGCYPDGERKRIKVSGSDTEAVEAAHEWLRRRPEVTESSARKE